MKRIGVVWFGLLTLTATACAQAPDVAIKLDLDLHYRSMQHGPNTLRFYDSLGNYSTLGLQARFESGLRAYVSEKLQRIPHDSDNEQLDEYYIEDPGIWRIGKQYLPFGRQSLFREDARAARGDAVIPFERIPISLAVCDNGNGRQRGLVGHIGTIVGLSFAIGNNFGIEGTSFDLVRKPEDAPGIGRGYRTVLGADFARHYQIYTLQAEAVLLRRGQTSKDPNTEMSDLSLTLQPNRYRAVTLGWSRDWGAAKDFYRLQGRFFVIRSLYFEPLVRFKGSELFELGASLRLKL